MLDVPLDWIRESPCATVLLPGSSCSSCWDSESLSKDIRSLANGWAWPGGIALGLFTIIWIVIQYVVIQHYFVLQPVIAGVGTAIIALLLIPSMRQYYRADVALDRLGIRRR